MTPISDVNFASALPQLARLLCERLGREVVEQGVFLRDGYGRVSSYARDPLRASLKKQLNKEALAAFGSHVSPFGALHDVSSPSFSGVVDEPTMRVSLDEDGLPTHLSLVDRRFFGRDWLTRPTPTDKNGVPIMVFNSIKGGVGRSTALFVLAMALSRANKNVLLIDLDLEAPGLGSLLFRASQPRYGVVDFLVEESLGGVRDDDLHLFVGASDLMDRDLGQGRVDVVPAVGGDTAEHPRLMLSKLSRALVEAPRKKGGPAPFIAKVRSMVDRLTGSGSYDVVLVDARAGLSEITAAPILGLGAINLFFATDHRHSFEGYRFLLSHLSMLPIGDVTSDWRRQSYFVHAKAKASLEAREAFDDSLYDVLAETFYEVDEGEDVFNFSYDDPNAPHSAWRIFFNSDFIDADPLKNAALLEEDVFKATYGSFLSSAFNALGFGEQDDATALEL